MDIMHYKLTFREGVAAVVHRPFSPALALANARLSKFASGSFHDRMVDDANLLVAKGTFSDVISVMKNRSLLEGYDSSIHIKLAHRAVEMARKEARDAYITEAMSNDGAMTDFSPLIKSRNSLTSSARSMSDLLAVDHLSLEAKKILRSFVEDVRQNDRIESSPHKRPNAFLGEIIRDRD